MEALIYFVVGPNIRHALAFLVLSSMRRWSQFDEVFIHFNTHTSLISLCRTLIAYQTASFAFLTMPTLKSTRSVIGKELFTEGRPGHSMES
jgi:hypothetical protein